MPQQYIAYFNGEWVPYSQVKIHADDPGFSVGDVVFDVERTFNGKLFRLEQHIQRLYRSLKYVRIDPGLSADEMHALTEEAVGRNQHLREAAGDFSCRQFVSRGSGGPHDPGASTVCVRVSPLSFTYADKYAEGLRAVVTKTRSYDSQMLDPKVKHTSRMNFVLAHLEANDVDPGAFPILTDMSGNLTEGRAQNVFIVADGVIRTPADDSILQGVSRGMVIELARQLGIPLLEEDVQPYDLYTADEAFFSSSGPCVLPVTTVDRRPIGDGRPGPVVQRLLAAWSEAVGMDIVGQALHYGPRM